MPARDFLHATVRRALVRDGWTITEDPLRLQVGRRTMYIDLGAAQLLGANRGEVTIAVEIKSFVGASELRELEQAVGQFVLYERALRATGSPRTLWLAVPSPIYHGLFQEALGELLLAHGDLRILSIDVEAEAIEQWIPSNVGEKP